MSFKAILGVIAIIFWVVRMFSKSKDQQQNQPAKGPKRKARPANSQKAKSIDDIFNEFVKEVENSKKKQTQTAQVKPVQSSAKKVKKQALDWQQVETTHIKPKKMLIDHEDYHHISHRIDASHQLEKMAPIEESEGEVFEFDINNIDWKQAIISREILDRKYC